MWRRCGRRECVWWARANSNTVKRVKCRPRDAQGRRNFGPSGEHAQSTCCSYAISSSQPITLQQICYFLATRLTVPISTQGSISYLSQPFSYFAIKIFRCLLFHHTSALPGAPLTASHCLIQRFSVWNCKFCTPSYLNQSYLNQNRTISHSHR